MRGWLLTEKIYFHFLQCNMQQQRLKNQTREGWGTAGTKTLVVCQPIMANVPSVTSLDHIWVVWQQSRVLLCVVQPETALNQINRLTLRSSRLHPLMQCADLCPHKKWDKKHQTFLNAEHTSHYLQHESFSNLQYRTNTSNDWLIIHTSSMNKPLCTRLCKHLQSNTFCQLSVVTIFF